MIEFEKIIFILLICLSKAQKQNLELLLDVMKRAGFTPLSYGWLLLIDCQKMTPVNFIK